MIKKISDIAKERNSFERGNFKNSPIAIRVSNERTSPSSEALVNNLKNQSSEKILRGNQQEYYLPAANKWNQTKNPAERNLSSDIALNNNQSINKSALIQGNNPNNNNYANNFKMSPNPNLNNASLKSKKYQNSGNILEWQEKDNSNSTPNVQRRQNNPVINYNYKEKNVEKEKEIQKDKYQIYSENEEKRNYFAQKEKFEAPSHNMNCQVKRVIPESREKFVKTNEQEYENTMNTIKNIEKNLMLAQIQKEKVIFILKKNI